MTTEAATVTVHPEPAPRRTRYVATDGNIYDVDGYAAKLAAETLRAEKPRTPDLSDATLAETFVGCASIPPADTYPAIRDAFRHYQREAGWEHFTYRGYEVAVDRWTGANGFPCVSYHGGVIDHARSGVHRFDYVAARTFADVIAAINAARALTPEGTK